jgi:uncharacterized membrane protein YhaH (DUF805 family)
VSFPQAVRAALSQYATFAGRARRAEYWWFVLFQILVTFLASTLDAALGTPTVGGSLGIFNGAAIMVLLVPSVAVAVRRLHDSGQSGWWYLTVLIPPVGIVLLVFLLKDGDPDNNRYGPPPNVGVAGSAPLDSWRAQGGGRQAGEVYRHPDGLMFAISGAVFLGVAGIWLLAAAVGERTINFSELDGVSLVMAFQAVGFAAVSLISLAFAVAAALLMSRAAQS